MKSARYRKLVEKDLQKLLGKAIAYTRQRGEYLITYPVPL